METHWTTKSLIAIGLIVASTIGGFFGVQLSNQQERATIDKNVAVIETRLIRTEEDIKQMQEAIKQIPTLVQELKSLNDKLERNKISLADLLSL